MAPRDALKTDRRSRLDDNDVVLPVDGREVRLTNLRKVFWPELGLTKGDLLRTTRTWPTCCCRTSAIARW